MYLFFKLIHIAAVILFLGNIITGAFWHAHAARTRDPKLLAHTMDGVIRSDRWFTLPGVLIIIAAGVALAVYAHMPIFTTGWLLWTIVLFAISGLAFQMRVAPLQRQLRAYAQAHIDGGFDFNHYNALAAQWGRWAFIATITPLAGLALMVMKPAL